MGILTPRPKIKLKYLCLSSQETSWPGPPVNGYRKKEMNTSPPKSGLNWKIFANTYCRFGASLVAQLVNNPPAMQETLVKSLGWENPLTPCRRAWQPTPVFLSGESHGHRSLVAYSPWGHKESDTTKWLSTAQHCHFRLPRWLKKSPNCQGRRSPGEGNGNLLQCFCLGNPMDRGAWWATVRGVSRESDMM